MLDELMEFIYGLYVVDVLRKKDLEIPVEIKYLGKKGYEASWNGYSEIAPTTMLAFKKLKEYLQTVEEFKIKEVD